MEPAIALRDATLADAEFLYDLRTDPDVAAASNAAPPADLEQHRAWLERALANNWARLFIVETVHGEGEDNLPIAIGQCRLDVSHDGATAEVSIALVRSARGHGIGTTVLQHIAREARAGHIRWLEAVIKETNQASRKAFLKAGYSVEEIKDGIIYMAHKCGL
jgi:RimJ/RimL family protein N-acetyltransferase